MINTPMALHFNILTLFPEMFPGSLGHSLAGKALERGDWSYSCTNIRDHGEGVHKSVDDTPYGGGAGMVMRADILEKALQNTNENNSRRIYLSPRGRVFNQALAKELSQTPQITLLCGRYEGVDQRFLDDYEFEEISIGDYVLSGGEPAALVMMDACIRLIPGVMGNTDTADNESFGTGAHGLLEYPHYTRPATWNDLSVPEILQSGNHAKIEEWRRAQSLELTKSRRPDLLKKD